MCECELNNVTINIKCITLDNANKKTASDERKRAQYFARANTNVNYVSIASFGSFFIGACTPFWLVLYFPPSHTFLLVLGPAHFHFCS